MSALLEHVRVLSVGHTLPAMYAIPVLRDLGARITLIEPPQRGPRAARYAGVAGLFPTRSLLAGTTRCALDLRNAGGRAAYLELARQADVILEGFRPGASTRLDIDYNVVKQTNPQVIYAAISGYGQAGPIRDHVGHDLNYLARSGLLHLTGPPGGPPAIPGAPMADSVAGLNAALNVLAALWRRAQTGRGAFLDIAIADAPAFLMAMEYDYFWDTGRQRRAGDTHLTGGYPWYHVFATADGLYLSVAAVEPQFYARLCAMLGRPDLATQQFADGSERTALFDTFAKIFRSRSRDEWLKHFGDAEVCVAPVLTPGEAVEWLRQHGSEALSNDPTPLVRSPMRLDADLDASVRPQNSRKYARPERERRFLLDALPAGAVVRSARLEDRYIIGTQLRLRLRHGTADGAPVNEYKLTQKIPAADGHPGWITTIYLSEAEYNVLAALPARPLSKTRHSIPPLGIDVFEPPLHGLILAEVEFASDEAAREFTAPPFVLAEVTHDERFAGGYLASTTREALLRNLAEFGLTR